MQYVQDNHAALLLVTVCIMQELMWAGGLWRCAYCHGWFAILDGIAATPLN